MTFEQIDYRIVTFMQCWWAVGKGCAVARFYCWETSSNFFRRMQTFSCRCPNPIHLSIVSVLFCFIMKSKGLCCVSLFEKLNIIFAIGVVLLFLLMMCSCVKLYTIFYKFPLIHNVHNLWQARYIWTGIKTLWAYKEVVKFAADGSGFGIQGLLEHSFLFYFCGNSENLYGQ